MAFYHSQLNKQYLVKLKNLLLKLKKVKIDFELAWEEQNKDINFYFKVQDFYIENLPTLHSLFKLNYQAIRGTSNWPDNDFEDSFCNDNYELVTDSSYGAIRDKITNSKYYTRQSVDDSDGPLVIMQAPIEKIVNGTTYRIVNGRRFIKFMASHMDKVYDYLDQYNLFQVYQYHEKNKLISKYAVANVFTYEILLVFHLLRFNSRFVDMLDHGFFINPEKSVLYRLKMEKGLTKDQKTIWKTRLAVLEGEYNANTTLVYANKLASGEVESGEFNNIKFTANSAVYHTVTLEYPKLFEIFMGVYDIHNQFDIYSVVREIAKAKAAELESAGLKKEVRQIKKIRKYGYGWRRSARVQEEVNVPKTFEIADESAYTDGVITLESFKINGITLTLTKHLASGHRKINGIRINANELEEVIYRCSCFQDELNYTNFLKQTSVLNLKATDAISAGLGVKIDKDYVGSWADPLPHPECTKLFFRIVDRKPHLVINSIDNIEKTVPVRLNYLIKKVYALNKSANANWCNGETKTDKWARSKLKPILKEASTFKKIVKEKNADGVEIEKEVVTEHLTDFDLIAVVDYLDLKHALAVEKSKEFLKMAVEATGAELIKKDGKEFYRIKGKLTTYIVNKENCKVFDEASQGYICIVNSSHDTGVGYDDLAARLYALHNDSVLVDEIYTLKHYVKETPIDQDFETVDVEDTNEPVINDNLDQELKDIAQEVANIPEIQEVAVA